MAIQDALPDRLGPYRLLDRIGEGGMGVVHLAADSENRMVAIKVLRPQAAGDVTARRRLAREVETMRRVRSPFVAEVIDADVKGGIPYIVTRYVPGRTLEDLVEVHGPVRGPRLQRLAWGLAGALTAVHAAGVVHRDLKPGNVMMVGDDPVVIDFGIAHVGDTTRLTQTGMFVGTPGYLAPEVIEGRPSGPAADVHSWGATVAFAATGRPPYGTGSYEVVFYRILQGSANLEGMSGGLRALAAAALAKDPAKRPTAAWLVSQSARPDLMAPSQAAPWPGGGGPAPGGRFAGGPAGMALPGGGAAGVGPYGVNGGSPAPATAAGPRAGPAPHTATIAGAVAVPGTVADPSAVYGPARMAAPGTADLSAKPRQQPGVFSAPGDTVPGSERSGDVADLLPPVRYGPPRNGVPGGSEAANRGLRAARPLRPHRLLALTALVFAVGVSLVLPVAGTAVVLFLIALLRAADRAQSGLAIRRSARGPRPTDALVVVASAPWALAQSLLVTIMLAPFLLLAAGIADVALLIAMRGSPLPVIGSYGAGIFVALNCLGPGSRRPRRQLNRTFNAVAGSPLSALATTVVLAALAAAMISLALVKAPLFWPVPNPGAMLSHLPGAQVAHGTVSRLRHLGHGLRGRGQIP
ncbi:MAG: protein kinase domain-containing protein [Micromonosporaceae bacterium]